MLPPGMSAHSAGPAEQALLRPLHRGAQTVAQLRVGSCSCDLIRMRDPDPRTDERHLRARYSQAGLPRAEIVRELERHRQGTTHFPPQEGWPAALTAFVSEHARNAELLSLDQLARELGVHQCTLRAAARTGRLQVTFSSRSAFGRPSVWRREPRARRSFEMITVAMEGRARQLSRFRQSLMTTTNVSSVFDGGWGSHSTISPAASAQRTRRWGIRRRPSVPARAGRVPYGAPNVP